MNNHRIAHIRRDSTQPQELRIVRLDDRNQRQSGFGLILAAAIITAIIVTYFLA